MTAQPVADAATFEQWWTEVDGLRGILVVPGWPEERWWRRYDEVVHSRFFAWCRENKISTAKFGWYRRVDDLRRS